MGWSSRSIHGTRCASPFTSGSRSGRIFGAPKAGRSGGTFCLDRRAIKTPRPNIARPPCLRLNNRMNRLLADLRIVELSAFVAAPLGGMTMAQLGAEVIRIDPIGGGIDHDRWPVTKGGASLYWA